MGSFGVWGCGRDLLLMGRLRRGNFSFFDYYDQSTKCTVFLPLWDIIIEQKLKSPNEKPRTTKSAVGIGIAS